MAAIPVVWIVVAIAAVLLVLLVAGGLILFMLRKKGPTAPPAAAPAALPPQMGPRTPVESHPAMPPPVHAPAPPQTPPVQPRAAPAPTSHEVPRPTQGQSPLRTHPSERPAVLPGMDPLATVVDAHVPRVGGVAPPPFDPGPGLPPPDLFLTTPSTGATPHLGVPAQLRADDGSIIRLDRQVLRMGRHPDNEIIVPTPGASRQHAEIQFQDGAWVLTDLNSGNGTFVNGVRVRTHRLSSGDEVRIDQTRFVFTMG